MRSNRDKVLGQGTAAYPTKPFGAKGNKRKRGRRNDAGIIRFMRNGFNARLPRHLGLPRAVGPYTVIRTTRTLSTNAAAIMFGTFQKDVGGIQQWRAWCGIEDVDRTLPVNNLNNTKRRFMLITSQGGDGAGTGSAFTCVPCALTVQAINTEPLQTTTGVLSATAVNQSLDLSGRASDWDAVFAFVMQYFPPRLISAGKLALRGVEVSSYPLNMSEFSNFLPLQMEGNDDVFTSG